MGMSACVDRLLLWLQISTNFFIGCLRQDDMVKGLRRTMIAEQCTFIIQVDLYGWLECMDKCQVRFSKLSQLPVAYCIHPHAALLRDIFCTTVDTRKQPIIGIAHDHRTIEFSQACDNIGRLRST